MISNYNDFKKLIENQKEKKTLLLHSCCAPCSSYVLTFLAKYFKITVFYSNDNIFPMNEFYKRLEEQKKIIELLNLNIEFIDDSYNESNYYKAVSGYEDLGEKSVRCYNCYKMRLEKTAIKAKELGFDYFTTTLSVSPYKISTWINEIGYFLEKKYNINFLYSDFKKEEGYKKSIKLSNDYELYRQHYCGCVFSYEEVNK